MKKFISMVMAAAMVVSLVPATAFAAGEVSATAKVVDAWEKQAGEFDGNITVGNVPELQLTVTNVDYQKTYEGMPTVDVEVALGNADWAAADDFTDYVRVKNEKGFNVMGKVGEVGGKEAAAAFYKDVVASDEGNYMVKDIVDGEALEANVVEIPTFTGTEAVTVAEKVAALVKDGYTLIDAVKDDATGNYTGFAAKAGAETIDLKTLEADEAVPAWKQKQAFIAEWAEKGYVRANVGELVPAVLGVEGAEAVVRGRIAIAEYAINEDGDKLTFTFAGKFAVGDIISIDLYSVMDKYGEGKVATVSVDSKLVDADDLVYASVLGKVLKAEVDKLVEVAEEEVAEIKDLTIKAAVGTLPAEVTLKLSKGFEFVSGPKGVAVDGDKAVVTVYDDDQAAGEMVLKGIVVEATSAKAGDVATIKVTAKKFASASVEVAKVCEYKVVMELADADEDVPVIYSGVSVDNAYINDDSTHESLEVKLYETFAGAWDQDKAFTLSLPAGVYVTDVDATGSLMVRNTETTADLEDAFKNAYIKGDHVDFEFAKRVFVETDPEDRTGVRDEASDVTFSLTLIADPGFVGDVTLKVEGAAIDTQEVVIAKFVTPMTVKAEQNDVIIDYRYTEVPTAIVVTEAEAGLWADGFAVDFDVEDNNTGMIDFEDDATFTVNAESEMEINDTTKDGVMTFVVEEESDEEAAVVTIDGIKLFMQRNIPAGPYALDMVKANAVAAYDAEVLLGQGEEGCTHKECATCADVNDYSTTVKEAWINVVTAGRDQDDASFTTTVVVPVGETTIYAGDKAITLDVPAYINADGYTMLPVRAVATALGINNNAVQWDQATKTVIIMYGQRIITMTAGQSVVYVSGTAIPAKSAVEIVDGRAFLGLRDLATTLGVSEIAWDGTTNVATLNPVA